MSKNEMDQSTKDALADADTLRIVAADHFSTPFALGETYATRWRWYHCYGASAIFGLNIEAQVPAEIFALAAKGDAHSAFLAVPGLRG